MMLTWSSKVALTKPWNRLTEINLALGPRATKNATMLPAKAALWSIVSGPDNRRALQCQDT